MSQVTLLAPRDPAARTDGATLAAACTARRVTALNTVLHVVLHAALHTLLHTVSQTVAHHTPRPIEQRRAVPGP